MNLLPTNLLLSLLLSLQRLLVACPHSGCCDLLSPLGVIVAELVSLLLSLLLLPELVVRLSLVTAGAGVVSAEGAVPLLPVTSPTDRVPLRIGLTRQTRKTSRRGG